MVCAVYEMGNKEQMEKDEERTKERKKKERNWYEWGKIRGIRLKTLKESEEILRENENNEIKMAENKEKNQRMKEKM